MIAPEIMNARGTFNESAVRSSILAIGSGKYSSRWTSPCSRSMARNLSSNSAELVIVSSFSNLVDNLRSFKKIRSIRRVRLAYTQANKQNIKGKIGSGARKNATSVLQCGDDVVVISCHSTTVLQQKVPLLLQQKVTPVEYIATLKKLSPWRRHSLLLTSHGQSFLPHTTFPLSRDTWPGRCGSAIRLGRVTK